MMEQYFNGLKYDMFDFSYLIDFNLSDRNKRVKAKLLGIECDDIVLTYVHACCQTFLRSKRFREDEIKCVFSLNGGSLFFDIKQKDGMKFLLIQAKPKGAALREHYYDYHEAVMLTSALVLCLKYMTAAK